MRIAVMAAGGVGGYFGARLAAAGANVAFVARGAHLDAIRGHGLRVESQLGNLHLRQVSAADRPEAIGAVDIVLFAVKLWDTEAAAQACRSLIGPETGVICLQNGIDGPEILTIGLGRPHVIGGTAHIATVIGEPGVIRHTGTMARLTFGEFDRRTSSRGEAFHALCKAAGIDAVLSPDINRAIWDKFVFLATFSGMTALTRLPKAPILADPETRAMFHAALAEVVAVARVKGIDMPADHADALLRFGDGLPAEMKSSLLHDLERGNRLEVPWLSGAVARIGGECGVPTPVHRFIATALKLHAEGKRPS